MLRSNLKLIFRQLKNIYSFLNLLGLTIGFTLFILIFLWVNEELSYDRFHVDSENIYRVLGKQGSEEGSAEKTAFTCAPLAEYLKNNFDEVKESCRVRQAEYFLKYNESGFYKFGIGADPSFFRVFDFRLTSGSLASFEEGVDKIIISEQLAEIFFGKEDPIGKVFVVAGRDVAVVGVMENVPTNSHLRFDYVIPMKFIETIGLFKLDDWNFYVVNTYIKTTSVNKSDIDEKIKNVVIKNSPESTIELSVQPLTDIHLKSVDIVNDLSGHGNIVYVYLFSTIAIFVLVIASINYSNLATARSIKRSKETGVRKVMGSSRFQLASFFFAESILYSVLALSFALFFSWLLLPQFNELTGKQLIFNFLSAKIIVPLLFFVLLCAMAGGTYPALILSAQNPVIVFKGLAKADNKAILLRRALVVIQFVLSIALLTGTLIIQRQLAYIQSKNLGYEKENMITFTMIRKIRANYATIKDELLKLPGINAVTASSEKISFSEGWTDELVWEGKNPSAKPIFYQLAADHDFLKTFRMSLIAGRDFSKEISSDSFAVILNEEALKLMNLKDPVNKSVKLHEKEYTIIGIVKNFHFKSIHKKIDPLIIYIDPARLFQLSIRLSSKNLPEQLKAAEAIIKKFTPDRPFDYTFLGDDIQKRYVTENRTATIFKYFSAFAIFISCLGLLGIILFVTEQRAKELAIRKVLGAPVYKLMMILSLEYVILAVIGFSIVTPIVYYMMGKWLSGFAYHAEMDVSLFALAGLVTLLFAWLTVAFRSYQAATNNPVKSLRTE
jgi:putative ABC transport system permease protein